MILDTELSNRTLILILTGILCFLFFFFSIWGFLVFRDYTIREFRKTQKAQNENTILYDIDNQPFYVIKGLENRRFVPLKQMSTNLQKAVLGIEDARFFQHFGFDIIRIGGAILHAIRGGTYLQGASTITQQLVKLSLLNPERTVRRKVLEILMAVALETEYTKKEILEFYLNKVYLGHRNYGVENAAQNYFHKTAKELNLAESAFIAGLIKKPEGYSPFQSVRKARKRQLLVLKRMLSLKWISEEDYKKAARYKVVIRREGPSDLSKAPYFMNHVLLRLKNRYGTQKLYGGGLRIYTTLDRKLQDRMDKVVARQKKKNRSFDEIAGIAIDPKTGFVKALVGGFDFHRSEFNRATQAKRQPGSSIKPFLYAAALSAGMKTNDVLIDEPTPYIREVEGEMEIYEPQNFAEENKGSMTLAHALQTSNNVISVKVLHKIGIRAFVQVSRQFGLEIPGERGLCVALGCGETTLLDLTSAYSTFANDGKRNEPVFILKVKDHKGRILEEYIPLEEEEVLSPEQNFQMRKLLQNVIEFGTGRNAKIQKKAGGKTGTTNSYRDAWFIGFTRDLVTGFWIGNDDNKPMRQEMGGRTPARLWADFMRNLPSRSVRSGFAFHKEFEEYRICVESGLLAGPWCRKVAWYALHRDHAPEKYCPIHNGPELELKICTISGQLATRYCPPTVVETRQYFHGEEPYEFCRIHNTFEPSEQVRKEQKIENTIPDLSHEFSTSRDQMTRRDQETEE